MKVLVTGAKGQLGTDLMNELEKRGIEGIGVVLVQSIQGDYPNIVGLPVAETLRRLGKLLEA